MRLSGVRFPEAAQRPRFPGPFVHSRLVLLVDAVDPAVRPAEVTPRVVQRLDVVDVADQLASRRGDLVRCRLDVIDAEAVHDAVVEAPRTQARDGFWREQVDD